MMMMTKNDFDRFRLKTRSTIPFGWLIKFADNFFVANNVSDKVSDIDDDDDGGGAVDLSSATAKLPLFLRFRLKTRNTIPFGWPIKLGRRIFTLFLLFLPGGALSALLSEGGGLEALMKLPSLLLSLFSSETAQ